MAGKVWCHIQNVDLDGVEVVFGYVRAIAVKETVVCEGVQLVDLMAEDR